METSEDRGYRQTESAKKRLRGRRYAPEKQRAWKIANAAIKAGELVRRPCEECGAKPGHAHHHDYAKPLDVQWLCARHHRLAHQASQQF